MPKGRAVKTLPDILSGLTHPREGGRKRSAMRAGIVIGDVGPGCSINEHLHEMRRSGFAHFIQVVFNVRPEQRHEQADDNQSSQNFKKCKTFIVCLFA